MNRKATSLLLALVLSACQYELDTTRRVPERGTLGEEVQKILQKDLDRRAPEKGQAFARWRDEFVPAVDTLMPEPLHDDLQNFLVAMLPLYDEGLVQGVLRPLACFSKELAEDEDFTRALWYAGHTEGYGAPGSSRLLRRALGYEGMKEILDELAGLWLSQDGLDDSLNPTQQEKPVFDDLAAELARRMSDAEPESDPHPSEIVNFILRVDGRLQDGEQRWLVRLDRRGRAMAATDAQGRPVAPFADADGDGLADIDPQSGDFIDENGAPLAVPPPFDQAGERSRYDGRFIYQYADTSSTVLSAVVDQLRVLVEKGILWDLDGALPALLGPVAARADDQGVYSGYAPEQSPLYAAAHALFAVLDYPRAPQLVRSLQAILELRETQLAAVVHELDAVSDIVDRYPDISLAEHNRLLDDLVPHLLEMAQRGYIADYLRSFSDPRSMGLQQGLAKMIKYRDHLVDPDDPDGRTDMVLDLETDFSAPDTVYSNRSNLQKMMHLTWDTNGVPYDTELIGISIFHIDDMCVFWLDSAADGARPGEGLAEVPALVQGSCGEFSSTHPPAEEVNRFMNHDHDNGDFNLCNLSSNPVGREGKELVTYNAEALLAVEVSGLLDALRPGITAVARKDRNLPRTGTKVLADLLAAIHPHYSSNVPNSSPACAELRRLEPMLLDILENTHVLDATVELLASLNGLKTMQGEDVIDELAQFTLFLLEPDQTLLRHDGANWVYGGDGVTQVSPISRLYLLLDALRMLDDAVAGDPAADRAVQTVWDKLYDRFLGVEDTAGLWRFANRRAWTVLLNLVDFLAEKVARYSSEGTLSQKLAEWERDFADLVGGRTLPRLVDVLHSVAQNPRLPSLLDGLILHLLDGSDPAWLSRMRYELGWYLQWLAADKVTVPAGRALAPVIDPRAAGRTFSPEAGQCLAEGPPNTFLSRVMKLAERMSKLDCCERDVLAELLLNASQDTSGPESYPLGVLLDVVGAVHRLDPPDESEKSPQDWANIIGQVSEYLLDGERGVEKLYDIIAHRKGN